MEPQSLREKKKQKKIKLDGKVKVSPTINGLSNPTIHH